MNWKDFNKGDEVYYAVKRVHGIILMLEEDTTTHSSFMVVKPNNEQGVFTIHDTDINYVTKIVNEDE